MAESCSARSETIPPLPWTKFAPPFPTVRLSGETAAKQARRHPDLEPADYARVQRILDQGEMFVEDNGRFAQGFLEEDGRLWKAVVKSAAGGDEAYIVSLHKAQPHNLDAARHPDHLLRWPRFVGQVAKVYSAA